MPIDVSGDDRIDVVGESFRRDALARIAGIGGDGEVLRQHIATLVPEPTNAYDRNAIKVLIAGEHVGYIPRDLAAILADGVSNLRAEHGDVTTLAELNGSGTEYGFGVVLHLKLQMLNVVIVRDDGEDLDDDLLIGGEAPTSSVATRVASSGQRTRSEAASVLGVSEDVLESRQATVERAVQRWKSDLIDLTARNRLLYLKDLRTGTLSFESNTHEQLLQLVAGKRVALSKLVPRSLPRTNPASTLTPFEDAVRRTRAISRTARAYDEERGVRTLYLACGVASWQSNRASRPPAAPVLLVPIEIRARGASQQDFELSTLGDLEVNPTLLHLLQVEFQLDVDPSELFMHAEMDGAIDTPEELQLAFDWLGQRCADIPGWEISNRFVLGNFWYAKLPMVRDLETAIDTLASHDVAAALAGDAGARDAVVARRNSRAKAEQVAVDRSQPAEEFNVLDSDSSQSRSITRALAGEDLVLKGPPGTGKSQTIANLICNAIANGKRVLFVAEKRAAIDAVTKRLNASGLQNLVLDLHRGAESRKWLAGQLGVSLEEARTAGVGDDAHHPQLTRSREALKAHAEELHRPVAPWGVSVYEAQTEVIERERPRVGARLQRAALESIDRDRLEVLTEHLRDLLSLGGLSLRHNRSPWADAQVTTADDVRRVTDALRTASDPQLDSLEKKLQAASSSTEMPAPANLPEAERDIDLWRQAESSAETFTRELFGHDVSELERNLKPLAGGGFARFAASATSSRFRAARRTVLAYLKNGSSPAPAELAEAVERAAVLQNAWQAVAPSPPEVPESLDELQTTVGTLRDALVELGGFLDTDLTLLAFPALREKLAALVADRGGLAVLPEIYRARTTLADAGLSQFLTELEERQELIADAEGELQRLWWVSLADELALTSVEGAPLAAFRGERHEQTRDTFRELDRHHIQSSAQRVRRTAAEAAISAQDRFPEQAQLVRSQATRKRGHLPVRELFLQAPDVLTALRPCWVMSPLMVSQLIPAERPHFDIVVFDEASQVRPVDALSSMIRGRQMVVAGDERQLPPTSFFDASAAGTAETDAEQEDETEIGDYESVLDVLIPLFETEMLRWHYRSRDERLIGFSNQEIYDGSLTTFPGAVGGDVLVHSLVDELPREGEHRVTPDAEVRRVVELVLDHATHRPHESLGVIALGSRHADAIEGGVLNALADRPELEDFFSEEREERFFVKNLERVQGDERDAIILAVGYGKNPDGTLPHRFGPLNNDGGERRLNVAVTRAKRRMTVVSSFQAEAIDPKRSRAVGVRLLKAFLEYAAAGGDVPILQATGESSVLHRTIEETLNNAGHRVDVMPGTSADRLDLAVLDPDTGLPSVAIDLDGPSYAARHSVRDRDRLRPEQLERLGWQHVPTWSQDWYRDPVAAGERLLDQVGAALGRARESRVSPRSEGPVGASARREQSVEEAVTHVRSHLEPRIRPEMPDFASGGPSITDWEHDDLVALARWIESDGLLRTSEELQREMMSELGFSRRGSRVAAALDAAVASLRGTR